MPERSLIFAGSFELVRVARTIVLGELTMILRVRISLPSPSRTVISSGAYSLMWDLAKNEIPA